MLIRLGFDFQFDIPSDVPFVGLLSVHPSKTQDLLAPEDLSVEPATTVSDYLDSFGNRCTRFQALAGNVRLRNSALIEDCGAPDLVSLICSGG